MKIDDEGLSDDNDGLYCTDDGNHVPGNWNRRGTEVTNSRLYDSTGITAYWNSIIPRSIIIELRKRAHTTR
jgi:hypothetical protein